MSITVEGSRTIQIASPARLVDDSREMAWAETHIRKAPDCKWVLGNFIEASTEHAENYNSNGHRWDYGDDLRNAVANIPHRPLNLLHAPGRRVGAMAAAEFVWPEGEKAGEGGAPIVEAVACLWSYYEPDLIPALEMAHRDGTLWFSMECLPKSITCKGKGDNPGCDRTYEYDGRTSSTYCSHLNEVASRKILNKGIFTGCALILPPVRPGWANADVKEISHLIAENLAEAELAYEQIAEEFPHLGPREWENMMGWLLAASS